MSASADILRFAGAGSRVLGDEQWAGTVSSYLFQAFATWLGGVYAAEHNVPVDPAALAEFDANELIPAFRAEEERVRPLMQAGLTIEEVWFAEQLLLRRPSTCLLVDRYVGQPVNRVSRLRVAAAEEVMDQLLDRLRRNFRFPDRSPGLVSLLEDTYFEPAAPVQVGVLTDDGGHAVSLTAGDPRDGSFLYHDPWQDGTLLPGTPTGERGVWRIDHEALERSIVYAFLPDELLVERSPDIYAPGVRREADPSKGAPLDVAWHAVWQLAGPTYCLVVEGSDPAQVERIPYRATLPAGEIIQMLEAAFRQRDVFFCEAHVRLGPSRWHSVTVSIVDGEGMVFHDPWPGGSLLRAGENELGIAAREAGRGWRITRDEAERCLHAVFLDPVPLAELQGLEHRLHLPEVLDQLGFFGIREVERREEGEQSEVLAQPGGFQENIRISFMIDNHDQLEAALLGINRSWLNGPDLPFGLDLAGSFLSATVSPLDQDEAALAVGALKSLVRGRDALSSALSSGPAHLLGQARLFASAILGAVDSALVSLAFTRIVARNDSDAGWLQIGVERWERAAGPFLVDSQLPSPWASTDGP